MKFLEYVPFMLLATGKKAPKLNITRIIEACVIALLGGIVAGYIAVKQLEIEFSFLKTQFLVKNGEQDTRISELCRDVGTLKERVTAIEARHNGFKTE